MNRFLRRLTFISLVAAWAAWQSPAASGAVTNVMGSASASVVQFNGGVQVQTDSAQEVVPDTKSQPPAVARARLDRPDGTGGFTAASQCLAQLAAPNLSGVGNPNDAGVDLGTFSSDGITSWSADGEVIETRTVVLSAADIGSDNINLNGLGRTTSHVLLSGIMVITALDTQTDLTGVQVSMNFQVTLRQEGLETSTPIDGEVVLAGGPDGAVIVDHQSGALANVFIPVLALNSLIPDLPLVQAITFTGTNLPYEYQVAVDQPFELELKVHSRIVSTPGGIGAAATFGTTQEGINTVLQKLKRPDASRGLAELVAEHVDTTGLSYVNNGWTLFPACGLMGAASTGLLAVSVCVMGLRGRRRRTIRSRRR